MPYKIISLPSKRIRTTQTNIPVLVVLCSLMGLMAGKSVTDTFEENQSSILIMNATAIFLTLAYLGLSNDPSTKKQQNVRQIIALSLALTLNETLSETTQLLHSLDFGNYSTQYRTNITQPIPEEINLLEKTVMMNQLSATRHIVSTETSGTRERRYWFKNGDNDSTLISGDEYDIDAHTFFKYDLKYIQTPLSNISWVSSTNLHFGIHGTFSNISNLNYFNFHFYQANELSGPTLPIKMNTINLDEMEFFRKSDEELIEFLKQTIQKVYEDYATAIIMVKPGSTFFRPLKLLILEMRNKQFFMDSCHDDLDGTDHITCVPGVDMSNRESFYKDFQETVDCFSFHNPETPVIEIYTDKFLKRQRNRDKRALNIDRIKETHPIESTHILDISKNNDFQYRTWFEGNQNPLSQTIISTDFFIPEIKQFTKFNEKTFSFPIKNIQSASIGGSAELLGNFPGTLENEYSHTLKFRNVSQPSQPQFPVEDNVIDLDKIEIFEMCKKEIKHALNELINELEKNYSSITIKAHRQSTLFKPLVDLIKRDKAKHFFIDTKYTDLLKLSHVDCFGSQCNKEETYKDYQTRVRTFKEENPQLTVVEVLFQIQTKGDFETYNRQLLPPFLTDGETGLCPILKRTVPYYDIDTFNADCNADFEKHKTHFSYNASQIRGVQNILSKDATYFEKFLPLISDNLHSAPDNKFLDKDYPDRPRHIDRRTQVKYQNIFAKDRLDKNAVSKTDLAKIAEKTIKNVITMNLSVFSGQRAISRNVIDVIEEQTNLNSDVIISIIDSIKDKIEEEYGVRLLIFNRGSMDFDLYAVNINLYSELWREYIGGPIGDIETCLDNNFSECQEKMNRPKLDLFIGKCFGIPDVASKYYVMNDEKAGGLRGILDNFEIMQITQANENSPYTQEDPFMRWPNALEKESISNWVECSASYFNRIKSEAIPSHDNFLFENYPERLSKSHISDWMTFFGLKKKNS
ncbi:hypothetical protein HOG98_08585 [bacterium]|jgi:hypothetical protein|nr:hypothetical protein [bacterium]